MYNFDFVNASVQTYRANPFSKELSPTDSMHNQWYFDVGGSAIEVIAAAMLSSWLHRVDRVLDLPCGHGRVLRHLVRMFPSAQFDACDLDAEGVEFCAKTFGAKALHSKPELSEMDFGATYDLIWVGSLFTHVPEAQTARWLAHLAKFLSPHGIVVATLHGRWSVKVNEVAPYIGADRWAKVLNGYETVGYGYSDYVKDETVECVPEGYGISLARPNAIVKIVEAIPGIRIYSYNERAWADHQDVLVFGGPAHDKAWT
jgi:SAM-dependent methyltransferase